MLVHQSIILLNILIMKKIYNDIVYQTHLPLLICDVQTSSDVQSFILNNEWSLIVKFEITWPLSQNEERNVHQNFLTCIYFNINKV